jgi:hypothetical protein
MSDSRLASPHLAKTPVERIVKTIAAVMIEHPDEAIKRQVAEVERLARLAPGEWRLWLPRSALRLGIPAEQLEATVKDILKQREQETAREERRVRDEERKQARTEKNKERKTHAKYRLFKSLKALTVEDRQARLAEWSKLYGDDVAVLCDEFEAYLGESPALEGAIEKSETSKPWDVEPWDEPVNGSALLTELEERIRRHVVMPDAAATVTVFWTVMTWLHNEIATHSPILSVTSPEPDSGKTTLLNVISWLVRRRYVVVETTGPTVYRIVDRHHPTLIIDEADDLFARRTDLKHIVNSSWTRGTTIPRTISGVTKDFDPFCPKAFGLLRTASLPDTVASRSIFIWMLPKKLSEKTEDFMYADDAELLDLRRKLARWAADNTAVLKGLSPTPPPEFGNRLAANWKLLFAISDQIGEGWPKRLREAAQVIAQNQYDPSWGKRLIAAICTMFEKTKRDALTSADIEKWLTSDPNSEWRDFDGRGPIKQRQIAWLLKDYRVRPKPIHPTKRATLTLQGYERAQFSELFERLLPERSTHPHTTE